MSRQIKFRNYKPHDETLIKLEDKVDGEAVPEETIVNVTPATVDPILDELSKFESQSNEINIVPAKENWDLKQLAAARLSKLRKRTNRSIVDLLREKLQETDVDAIEEN